MASELPNILWISTDQKRWDTVHCLNNPHIHTPVVDRLCAEGVAFSHTYCQTRCASRAAPVDATSVSSTKASATSPCPKRPGQEMISGTRTAPS